MANFYEVTFGVSEMSASELDHIAMNNGGVVGRIGGGFGCQGTPAPAHGYEFLWIGTGGCGNQGTLVMRGTTPQTRHFLWLGRVNRIMGLGATEAQARVVASVRAPYAREERVIKTALSAYRDRSWDSFPGIGNGVGRWAASCGLDLEGLSAPRLQTVNVIVLALRENDPVPLPPVPVFTNTPRLRK